MPFGKFLSKVKKLYKAGDIFSKLDNIQQALGRIESRQVNEKLSYGTTPLEKYEFKVYSQWGEDGIIQYIVNNIDIPNKVFVEFGVEDYREANTRFLLINNNWSGLVMDGSEANIERIKADPIYWRYNLKAERAFIDRDNINGLIKRNGITGDIGLLSVDIDGNDYWVWEAIDIISPRIVVCEYDSLLGSKRAVTIPYDKNFYRSKAHYSFLYGGSSIKAFDMLAKKKGYSLIGSNSTGLNLFFVRNDLINGFRTLTPEEAYVKAKFRNSRDSEGNLSYLSADESLKVIKDMPLVDLESNSEIKVKDLN
jgi:hypothetical protein